MDDAVNETHVAIVCNMNCRSEDCSQNFGQAMCVEEDGLKAKHKWEGKSEVMSQPNSTRGIS